VSHPITFGDLYAQSSRNGLTKPKAVRGTGTKMLNMGEIFAHGRIKAVHMDRVQLSESEAANSLLERGDLLFARQSLVLSGAGKCSIFWEDEEPVCFESHIIRVRIDHTKANPAYLYYFFQSPVGRASVESIVEQGAGVAGIRGSDLARLKFHIPDLGVQHSIASILSSLDDKIELNRQMNETLEAIARAIFKDWFVEFGPTRAKMESRAPYLAPEIWCLFPDKLDDEEKPEGWSSAALSDLVRITSGKRPALRSDHLSPEASIPIYGGAGPMAFTNGALFDTPLLLTGRVGTLGIVHRITFAVWPSDNTLVLIPRAERYLELAYLTLKTLDLHLLNRGSTQPLLTQNDLGRQLIVRPSDILVRSFSELVHTMFERIDRNVGESHTLAQTRDLLLPKLMSGEIRVRKAEKMAEATL
jgi:type I restriction enzyme, S subunit